MSIIMPVNFKVGNYLAEYVSDSAPLGKMAKEAEEVIDEAHQYVSNSMLGPKKPIQAPKDDNSVDELVGNIINYFG
ncbi:MAG: hypothetical protein E7Z93_08520 [Cyanobacteria bacterium SIG32]|nr:hypothetical protein [Cyanobacteria bacterium SIG32]